MIVFQIHIETNSILLDWHFKNILEFNIYNLSNSNTRKVDVNYFKFTWENVSLSTILKFTDLRTKSMYTW